MYLFCFVYSRFIVRDFEYDATAAAAEAEERGKLELQLKKQFVSATTFKPGGVGG